MTSLENSIIDIQKVLDGELELPPQNKLGHRIMMTLQRRRCMMDWLIDTRSRGRVRPRIRRVLWWALAEMLWMNGVPSAAVVDVAVSYVKRRHSVSESAYINGLLRGILRSIDETGGNTDSLFASAPDYIRYNLPELLWKRWCNEYGIDETVRMAICLQSQAKTILRRRQWPKNSTALPKGLQLFPSPEWAPSAELYIPDSEHLQLDKYMGKDTQFYIQDIATLAAPFMLAAKPGEEVADLCASPGGKALLLGEMMMGVGHLLCCDKEEKKLARLRQNLALLPNADFECHDAAKSDYNGRKFDAIMLDVPCSNTGVIRRKPDVRWNFSQNSFNGLLKLQASILENAITLLKPNGRLVYSTCSIEHDENQLQIQSFLKKHSDVKLVKMQAILPTDEHDGAFAALLQKM